MKDLNQYIKMYKELMKTGGIQKAYSGLIKYVTQLRTNLAKNQSGNYSFASVFQGYMDYTYFYFSNDFLKKRKLKLGIVLNHSEMCFELWLLGQTIPIQEKYWKFFKTTKWNEGRNTKPQYSILETVLIENPDFKDLDLLSRQIEDKLVLVSEEIIEDIKKSELNLN